VDRVKTKAKPISEAFKQPRALEVTLGEEKRGGRRRRSGLGTARGHD